MQSDLHNGWWDTADRNATTARNNMKHQNKTRKGKNIPKQQEEKKNKLQSIKRIRRDKTKP
jgi:hypothetical protein